MQSILKLAVSSFFLINLALLTLSAREVGGGGYHGPQNYHGGNQGYHHYGNYEGYGVEGGGAWGGGYGVNPYPPPGSQPGMNDDSNALYNSYLRKNGQGY